MAIFVVVIVILIMLVIIIVLFVPRPCADHCHLSMLAWWQKPRIPEGKPPHPAEKMLELTHRKSP